MWTISLLAVVGVMTLVAPTSFVCAYRPGSCTTRAAAEASGQLPRLIAPAELIGERDSPPTSTDAGRRDP